MRIKHERLSHASAQVTKQVQRWGIQSLHTFRAEFAAAMELYISAAWIGRLSFSWGDVTKTSRLSEANPRLNLKTGTPPLSAEIQATDRKVCLISGPLPVQTPNPQGKEKLPWRMCLPNPQRAAQRPAESKGNYGTGGWRNARESITPINDLTPNPYKAEEKHRPVNV